MENRSFVIRHKDFKTLFYYPTKHGGTSWMGWAAKVYREDDEIKMPREGVKVFLN